MADEENTGNSSRDYIAFSAAITYELQRLRFVADAAAAMLGQHDLAETDETLVGTTYLLIDIASNATKLADRLSAAVHEFSRVPAALRAEPTGSPSEAPRVSRRPVGLSQAVAA